MRKLVIQVILLAMYVLHPAASDGKSLVKFLDESGIELSWEPYLETGRLSAGYRTVSFQTGQPWLLLDGNAKIPCEALYKKNGILLVPSSTEKIIRDVFFPYKAGVPRIGAIFIDPGHGGKDPGTIGRHKINGRELVVYEKDVVLEASLILDGLLKKKFPDKKVVLSRRDDTYLTLEERPELANGIRLAPEEAIVFISVHANASLNSKARGYEVWYLPPHYRRSLLTEDEVEEDSREILPILNTMLEEEFTIESILLARRILEGLDDEIGPVSENRGLKDESWFVVRKAKMPSVLVEIGFVTNPDEAVRLADPRHLQKIARAIYNGVVSFVRYFEETHEKGSSL